MEALEEVFLNRLDVLIKSNTCPQKRIVIALAGAPGSGKSTVASALTQRFNSTHKDQLQVIPMDGFHYPKATLRNMQSFDCPFRRRGAPFTFDAKNFLILVQRLSCTPVTEPDEPESAIWAPSFDHAIKDPVECDIRISSAQKVVLLEGSYLLLNRSPWRLVREVFSETWFISIPRETSKQRLIARHIAAGIELDTKSAAARAETNDLLNWELINENLIRPDVTIESI